MSDIDGRRRGIARLSNGDIGMSVGMFSVKASVDVKLPIGKSLKYLNVLTHTN